MPLAKKALIVGASGLIGGSCLTELTNDKEFTHIETWGRKLLKLSNSRLKSVQLDFTGIAKIPSTDATHIFCCLGTTIRKAGSKAAFREVDFEYVLEMAKLAERSKAEKFLVISSIGANSGSGNFYLRVKGEMEEAVRSLSIPSIIFMRPSMLLGRRPEFRIGEEIGKLVMLAFNFMLVGNLRKYRAIEAATVAKAMLTLAKEPTRGMLVVESDHIHKWQKTKL
jgi:uncharacterized protein YbjT (DUF2867 family)